MTRRPPGRRSGSTNWPFRRFVVADRSMEPTLVAGQGLVGLRWNRARPNELRCVEHPDDPGFWLVKRVESVGEHGAMRIRSDNVDVPTVDSRRFGAVPIADSYRVILRVPRRWM